MAKKVKRKVVKRKQKRGKGILQRHKKKIIAGAVAAAAIPVLYYTGIGPIKNLFSTRVAPGVGNIGNLAPATSAVVETNPHLHGYVLPAVKSATSTFVTTSTSAARPATSTFVRNGINTNRLSSNVARALAPMSYYPGRKRDYISTYKK